MSSEPSYDDVAFLDNRYTPEKIIELWEEGKTVDDICVILDISTTTVYSRLRERRDELKRPLISMKDRA